MKWRDIHLLDVGLKDPLPAPGWTDKFVGFFPISLEHIAQNPIFPGMKDNFS